MYPRLPIVEPPPWPNLAPSTARAHVELAISIEQRHEQVEINEDNLTGYYVHPAEKPQEQPLITESMVWRFRSTTCPLDLRHRIFGPFEQPLHFLHIDLRRRIMLMPHHLLHPRRIRIIEERKGGGGVSQTMDHNTRFLHAG